MGIIHKMTDSVLKKKDMRRKSFLLTLIIVLLGNTVAAKSFLDSLETRTQLPCDIQEYQQLKRQKLSTKVVSERLPQLFATQKEAEYYSLGKIVTKDCVLLLIEQEYACEYDECESNREGYICKIEGKGKGAFVSDIIHIVDNFRKVFILDGRKIIVSRVDTIDFGRKLDGLATEYYNLPDSYPASETKECTGLPKNLQEIKNVQWRELSTQYVKENIFQVQNEWNGNLFAYELPNENWQMISLRGNNYLCYKKGNERYPKMLEISDEIGKSINRQFFIVGSKIYILQMRIYDGEVAQWVEIYDLNDGELKRLYSSFRFGDNYEDGESDFISDMEFPKW